MLLRHTPKEIKERKALVINPAKTCQPIGAMYAALGIHGCLPHSHGSQGCCAYHRSSLTRHYKDPIAAATSSFTEGASVFGGQANLVQAIDNMFTVYDPEIIAVHTTCLSETIGDDVAQIADKAKQDGKVPEGKKIIYCHTPSYVGSHVTGFSNMVLGMVKGLAEKTGKKNGKVNVIPGYVEPSDMEEIKRLSAMVGVKTIMFPDTSGVVNSPMTGKYNMYPDGGTKIADLKSSGDSLATIALGEWSSADGAKYLDATYKVPCQVLDLPIGVTATDNFIDALRKAAGVNVPDSVTKERGVLVDAMCDYQQYFHQKKVALVGDPDQLIPLTQFCINLGMYPKHIVTGTPGNKFRKRMEEMFAEADLPYTPNVAVPGDMFLLHQWIKNEPVDLIIGNTYCKYIARDEDIPMVRHGFPILDRFGHSVFPSVGYKGAMRLMEQMLNAMLDKRDRESSEEAFELVY
ncbi:nitrogenase molybdenum-iron protein subunit beta [Desulfovibrio inopinatus]|uniref:nitrogenase molybdenum-iron protein subunit beta n=1 Tax=Desulfovibrio inopinatus TaxID=102109 RepID=UPI0003FEB668|nr:nitrogenase molybdenum-iron protein subunit beta [Desulfovibrio inopinatus]